MTEDTVKWIRRGLTLALFVMLVLKLTGLVDLPWWVVSEPLWLPVALFLLAAPFAIGQALYEVWKKP